MKATGDITCVGCSSAHLSPQLLSDHHTVFLSHHQQLLSASVNLRYKVLSFLYLLFPQHSYVQMQSLVMEGETKHLLIQNCWYGALWEIRQYRYVRWTKMTSLECRKTDLLCLSVEVLLGALKEACRLAKSLPCSNQSRLALGKSGGGKKNNKSDLAVLQVWVDVFYEGVVGVTSREGQLTQRTAANSTLLRLHP